MAQLERDNAPTSTTSEQHNPRFSQFGYTQTPLFVSRYTGEREDIFAHANRRRRAKRAAAQEAMERRSSNEESPTEEVQPAPMGSGNNNDWLDRGEELNERRFGLTEAWQKADDNVDARPRTVHGTVSGDASRPSPLPESRIPRSRTYSPGQKNEYSPRTTLTDAYRMAEREEDYPLPDGSESESTDQRQGSPSPAARNRRQPRYQSMTVESRGNNSYNAGIAPVDVDSHRRNRSKPEPWNGIPLSQDPQVALNREKRLKESAALKRLATSNTPLFTHVHGTNVGTRVAETTRALERKTSEPHLNEDDVVEPPMHNYKSWGEKARKRPGWVTRILSPESSVEVKDLQPAANDEVLKTAAETPLPSIEGSEPTPPSSRPSSAQPINVSPEKSKMWDAEVDFTAQSLQISTSPQLRVRPTKLDQLRDREILTLTARAVATNRLEEIRERNSEERSVLSDVQRTSLKEPTPELMNKEEREEPYYERTILEEEGEHIAGTPITIFSAGSYRPSSSSQGQNINHGEDEQRPGHKREDSFELLRRLSRATSTSPALVGKSEDMGIETIRPRKASASEQEPRKALIHPNEVADDSKSKTVEDILPKQLEEKRRSVILGLGAQTESKRNSRSSSRPRSEIDPEERIAAEAKLFDLPDNKSERNSLRAPSPSPPSSDDEKFDETPRPKKQDPLSLPTPRVTGAYIETPAPTIRKTRKPRTESPRQPIGVDNDAASSSDEHQDQPTAGSRLSNRRRSLSSSSTKEARKLQNQPPKAPSRPPLINTATPASASEDLRRIKAEAQIEDSTLDDFDGLLDAVAESPEVGETTTVLERLVDLEYDEKGDPISVKERERRLERIILDRMNQHLKNTSSSIRDARQGIERLEHQVSSAATVTQIPRSEESQIYFNIKIPVPRLWVKEPQSTTKLHQKGFFQRNWKFTWLGFILTLFMSWFIAESTVCEMYCHPINSSRGNWHYSDPFFPWAIPTKLDQLTGKVVSTSVNSVLDSVDTTLWSPKRGRRKWYSRTPHMGASDWWLGRDGPSNIVNTGYDSHDGSEGSIFSDEVI